MLVYLIVNTVNGKSYVGQTIHTLDNRWRQHCRLQGKCRALENAIRKYGIAAFEISVVAMVKTQEELNRLEKLTCEALNTYAPHGYNLKEGGGAKGKMHEETKRIMRELALSPARLASFQEMRTRPDVRAKQVANAKKDGAARRVHMAKGHTPEVERRRIKAIALALGTPEYRKAQSELQREIQARPEVKAKKSAALTATWAELSDEARTERGRAISAGNIGVKKTIDYSPEAKAKRNAVALKRWESEEFRAARAAGMAPLLADPEFLKKRGEAISAALATKREDDPEFFTRRAGKQVQTCADKEAARTHCKNGHELTEANVFMASGKRRCVTCRRAAVARFKAKETSEAAPL